MLPTFVNANNRPLPSRRREALTEFEAGYILERYGVQSRRTLSIIAGVSQASIRRAMPLPRGPSVSGPKRTSTKRETRAFPPLPVLHTSSFKTASLSLPEAAHDFGLTPDAFRAWLKQARWIRHGRRGAVIAGAAQLTAGFLNQTVGQIAESDHTRIYYGSIRITPRGMASLRASLASGTEDPR